MENSRFVPHNIAKLLKEENFNDDCLGEYFTDGTISLTSGKETFIQAIKLNKVISCRAPLYEEVISWFEKNHNIFIETRRDMKKKWFNWCIQDEDRKWTWDKNGFREAKNFKNKNDALCDALEFAFKIVKSV